MRTVSSRVAALCVASLAALLAACADPLESPQDPDFGKASSAPTVTSADPAEATRDTTLDVTVTGSGFDAGSQVDFLLGGAPDPKVRTNSTRYVSSKQLVANVTIDADATISYRDVAVTTSTGKKGIGSEKFAVVAYEAPVTTTLADDDQEVATSLQIRSDGSGSYTDAQNLVSFLQKIGAWVLDSYNPSNATRRVYLEFSRPIAGSGPGGGAPVAIPSGLYYARVIARCNLYGTAMQSVGLGGTTTCPLHIRFDYGGSSYALQMNPLESSLEASYPQTDPATVTCVASSGVPGRLCGAWRITPSGTAGGGAANVAKLLKYVTKQGRTTAVDQGDFHFSFSIGVTDP
jgi:hypothetical protein